MRCLLWMCLGLVMVFLPGAAPGPALSGILQGLSSSDFGEREAAQKLLGQVPAEEFEMVGKVAEAQKDEEVKARLLVRQRDMLLELLGKQPEKRWPVVAHVRGRVVDEKGVPVPGMKVAVNSAAWGQEFGLGVIRREYTDDQGRFDLGVPFVGICYGIVAGRPVDNVEKVVLVEKDTAVGDVVWRNEPVKRSVRGLLVDEREQPVAGQKVDVVGAEGIVGSAVTGQDGQFVVANLPPYVTMAVVVHAGERTALEFTDIGDHPLKLQLAAVGSISGKVQNAEGKGLNGMTVYARPWDSGDWKLHVTTGEDGAYQIAGVAPGAFELTVRGPGFATPSSNGAPQPTKVTPGKDTVQNLAAERMGIVHGKVLDRAGKPVAGAVVALWSALHQGERDHWHYAQTDARGWFVVGTADTWDGKKLNRLQLDAYAVQAGFEKRELPEMKAGEVREVTLTLSGAMRMTGRVVDEKGKPVAGIRCRIYNENPHVEQFSAVEGRFDLGWVYLPKGDESLEVLFEAPRPKMGLESASEASAGAGRIADRAHAPAFYAHQIVKLQSGGEGKPLQVSLSVLPLLEFHGTVTNAAGKPVPSADVYLFTGDAEQMVQLPDGPWRGSGVRLGSVLTDDKGSYTVWAVREPEGWGPGNDYSQFVLGVRGEGGTKVVKQIKVPAEGMVEVNVKLGE